MISLGAYSIEQGSQTQIDRRATFQRNNALRAAVYWKKASESRKKLKKLLNNAKIDKNLHFSKVLRCARASCLRPLL